MALRVQWPSWRRATLLMRRLLPQVARRCLRQGLEREARGRASAQNFLERRRRPGPLRSSWQGRGLSVALPRPCGPSLTLSGSEGGWATAHPTASRFCAGLGLDPQAPGIKVCPAECVRLVLASCGSPARS